MTKVRAEAEAELARAQQMARNAAREAEVLQHELAELQV